MSYRTLGPPLSRQGSSSQLITASVEKTSSKRIPVITPVGTVQKPNSRDFIKNYEKNEKRTIFGNSANSRLF